MPANCDASTRPSAAASCRAKAISACTTCRATPTRSSPAKRTKRAGVAKYDSITTGGPRYKGVRNQCRPKIYTHDEGFYHYYMSFRCCAEADGGETDPRTPRQQKEGWDMKRVEKIAGISGGRDA